MAAETTEAYDERQRIVAMLRGWARMLEDGHWPGIEHSHRALLMMVAELFDGPRGEIRTPTRRDLP